MATPRKLTPAQIRAAWTLYQCGNSMWRIAGLSYENLGFPSQTACAQSYLRAFKAYGRTTRTQSEAARLRRDGGSCAGCGCPFDERTRACNACTQRHKMRRSLGKPYIRARSASCKGCGGNFDDVTEDCRTCRGRHQLRAKRARRAAKCGLAPVSTLRDADVWTAGEATTPFKEAA